MAVLSILPAEILLLIVDDLSDHEATLNLTYTCRQLYTLLHLHVFRALEISHRNIRTLSRLTHAFAQDPRCAQTVRILRFIDGPARSSRNEIQYDPVIIRPLLEAIPYSSGHERATHEANLKAGHNHASWLAILLPLLPNLEELSLIFGYLEVYTLNLLHRIIPSNPKFNPYSAPVLSHLKHVSVRHQSTKFDLRTSYILPFFRLPSLTSFTGRMIRDNRDTDGRDPREQQEAWYAEIIAEVPYKPFSNVTHLTLEHSTTRSGFAALLYACKQLKALTFTHGYADGDEAHPPFAPRRFHRSLCRHRESLEELTICYADGVSRVSTEFEEGFIGSFRDFHRLRTLRLRAQNILAFEDGENAGANNTLFDVLPSAIEELVIEDFEDCYDQPHMAEQVKDLIREAGFERGRFPNLRRLEVKGLNPMRKGYKHNYGFPRVLPIWNEEWEGNEEWGM
ncbi:hypothetical protein BJY01DRAFT_252931 [Aspergillus pseudoustus]|uniref:F-box domain-containing protein n=1 Tax=Aspergillus pseudoustus TaxID=1810923 RepID=A0ABR4J3T5_9EURO